MIDIKINLLSPEKKNRLDQLVRYIFIRKLLEIIFIAACLVAIVLMYGWYTIQIQYNAMAESSTLINREFSGYNQEIRRLNNTLRQFKNAGADYLPLTEKILEITNSLPDGIKISSLQINRQTGKFLLTGTAKNRDGLIKYQTAIEKITWLVNVETPTSQLFQKDNVNFEIRANLKDIPTIETKK